MLGVRPDASHDEVKAAFTAKSLKWSRSGDDETARYRLDEVRAAWAVLRSPAERAAYDRALSDARVAAASDGTAAPDIAAGAAPLTPAGTVTPSSANGRRRTAWLLGTVGVLVALLLTGRCAVVDDERVELDTTEPFAEGSCIAWPVIDQPVHAECGSTDAARVLERSLTWRTCGAGTQAIHVESPRALLCVRPPPTR
ncbi:MAG: DnaJ domain-containing protein [Acidimicrobiia bacterium]|nr:DnaJ domain-containing protein [Acidimicrobiia bacterium]